jgi:hypothetical protein
MNEASERIEERRCRGCGRVLARAIWRGSMMGDVTTYPDDAPAHLSLIGRELFLVCERCAARNPTEAARWTEEELRTVRRVIMPALP